MKTLEHNWLPKVITFEKIKPFTNVCVVTGISEAVNVEVMYTPKDKVIDICSYREYFENWQSNLSIEDIADKIAKEIIDSANPLMLQVKVYLDDPRLTPWSVSVHYYADEWKSISQE